MIPREYEYDPNVYPSPEPFPCGSPALVADIAVDDSEATVIADSRGIRITTDSRELECARRLTRPEALQIFQVLPESVTSRQLIRLGFRSLA